MADSIVDRRASEDEIAEYVRAVRADPARRGCLVDLLYEGATLYDGRGANTSARIRAWVMAAFEDVGLPDEGLPYVLEELESGREPVLVAAAARAVRGRRAPDPSLAAFLVRALWNISDTDDVVSLDALQPTWPVEHPTTASGEILTSLRTVGADAAVRTRLEEFHRANADLLSPDLRQSLDHTIASVPTGQSSSHCCASHDVRPLDDQLLTVRPLDGNGDGRPSDGHDGTARLDFTGIELEDQDGVRVSFDEFFLGRPTVVAFFYTRCPNPNKCSLTVTKLAALQRDLDARRLTGAVGIAAVTYDPGYDLPARLRRYGDSRGLRFGPAVRMLRATAGHELLRREFALRVGYTGSVVSRHGIELFLLDRRGGMAHTWSRVRWEPAEVLAEAAELVSARPARSAGA
jgi:protein SCO1/2